MIDIGGGTTDIAVFADGAIRHTAVIPIAGDHVTNDIAMVLRTPTKYAERIKIDHGCALEQLVDPSESVEVPSVGNRPPGSILRKQLTEVAAARYEELFTLVQQELVRIGFSEFIAAGIVLTGGSSKMPGVVELAEHVCKVPVRLGLPHSVSGFNDVLPNPIYSTGVGLLLYGQKQQNGKAAPKRRPVAGDMFSRVKSWFQGNF
jgi:cell division protein FtsA